MWRWIALIIGLLLLAAWTHGSAGNFLFGVNSSDTLTTDGNVNLTAN